MPGEGEIYSCGLSAAGEIFSTKKTAGQDLRSFARRPATPPRVSLPITSARASWGSMVSPPGLRRCVQRLLLHTTASCSRATGTETRNRGCRRPPSLSKPPRRHLQHRNWPGKKPHWQMLYTTGSQNRCHRDRNPGWCHRRPYKRPQKSCLRLFFVEKTAAPAA